MFKTIFKKLGIALLSGVIFSLSMVATYAVQTGVGFDEVVGDLKLSAAGALQSGLIAGNTALLQAYDVDGATYATFATLTSNNTPTMDLASTVTSGGQTISTSGSVWDEAHGGTDQTTYAQGDLLYADNANSLAKLPKGTTLQQLRMNVGATVPEWFTAAGSAYSRSATKTVCVNTSLDTTNCDYIADGTADEVQIQACIDAVTTLGGTCQLMEGTFNIAAAINIKSNVSLVGQGYGTVLKRTATNISILSATQTTSQISARFIRFDGNAASATPIVNFTSNTVTYADISDNSFINSGYVIAGADGVFTLSKINRNFANFGYANSRFIYSGNGSTPSYLEVIGNKITQIGTDTAVIAISVNTGSSVIGNSITMTSSTDFVIIVTGENTGGSVVSDNIIINGGTGIRVDSAGATVTGNAIKNTTNSGISFSGASTDNYSSSISANSLFNVCSGGTTNTIDAISIYRSNYLSIVGNTITWQTGKKPRYGIGFSEDNFSVNPLVVGNSIIGMGTASITDTGVTKVINSIANSNQEPQTRFSHSYAKNTSGGDLAVGDVVILKSVAAGNEVTTSTTAGDAKVYGMVSKAITDNTFGFVQTLGKTTALKVNGTNDIAIGDYLCAYSEAKIAYKCASGGTAIAIALETYATNDSAGVLDAILIPPLTYLSGAPALAGANTDITSLGSISTVDLNGGSMDGATVGAASASTGAFTTLTSSTNITCSATGSMGWSIVTGADTACNSTCTSACVMGWNTASGEVAVDCADVTADKCLCAGAS